MSGLRPRRGIALGIVAIACGLPSVLPFALLQLDLAWFHAVQDDDASATLGAGIYGVLLFVTTATVGTLFGGLGTGFGIAALLRNRALGIVLGAIGLLPGGVALVAGLLYATGTWHLST